MFKAYKVACAVLLLGVFLSGTLLAAGKAASSTAQSTKIDVKKLESAFKNSKCIQCHTWDTYKLGKPQKKVEDPFGSDQFGTSGPPDLSKLSPELVKEISRSKTFLEEYLIRKVKLRGKQHGFMFKGDGEDLKLLIRALLQQKK
ncbi:MAG: hypothetical protein HYW47_07700 [Deltaproteobacteria bacterium]|nr:hypothetical protein [Deltaproteobacteria bacterium]